jgi:hypothetical protein
VSAGLVENDVSELQQLRIRYKKLHEDYRRILPKVDPGLVEDLLSRQMQDPDTKQFYTVEVLTKRGIDTETARWYIFGKTGHMPVIYDSGTHFVTDQKLTLETLKEISDSDDVIEIAGEYSGSSVSNGPAHERH